MNFEGNEGLSLDERRAKALQDVLGALSVEQEGSWTQIESATIDGGANGPSLKGFSRKGVEGQNVYGIKFI